MRTAIYRKNIRQWEQWSRIVAGVAMAAGALAVPSTVAKVLLVGSGAFVALTGLVGWCPACAMVGRRLEEDATRAAR
jgi:hypothetical protein